MTLSEGSMIYKNWYQPPVPIYLEVYLFNWTNHQDVSRENYKPHFTEHGPYTFLERHDRVDVEWHDNDTVSFNQTRIWHFQPHLSNGSLDDTITNVDVVAAVRERTNQKKCFSKFFV